MFKPPNQIFWLIWCAWFIVFPGTRKLKTIEIIYNFILISDSFSVGFQAFLHVDVSSLDNDKIQFDYKVNINLGNG